MTRITGQFELQARTILTPGNTTNITATIFSAVAMSSHGNNSILKERVQVWKHQIIFYNNTKLTLLLRDFTCVLFPIKQVEIGTNNEMVILINGTNVSSNLSAVNSTVRYDTVYLERLAEDTVTVAFSNDITVNVTLRMSLMSFVVLVPQSLLNNTDVSGLLGNIDGNRSNEFVYRNGTMLPDDSSDRILHTFGQSCNEWIDGWIDRWMDE